MKISSKVWSNFYEGADDIKPLIPESFIARIFLSTSPLKLLKSYDFKNKKVLDVGCGNGRHSLFLSQLGFDVYGCEVDDDIPRRLNKKFSSTNFFKSHVDSIDIEREFFDYIVAANSIYYLNDLNSNIKSNIAELKRVLKNNGCMVISFVGKEHFLLRDCIKLNDKSVVIKSDPLGFRNDTRIRPIWDKEDIFEIINAVKNLNVGKICEIKDMCDEYVRHLFYCVIYKD